MFAVLVYARFKNLIHILHLKERPRGDITIYQSWSRLAEWLMHVLKYFYLLYRTECGKHAEEPDRKQRKEMCALFICHSADIIIMANYRVKDSRRKEEKKKAILHLS